MSKLLVSALLVSILLLACGGSPPATSPEAPAPAAPVAAEPAPPVSSAPPAEVESAPPAPLTRLDRYAAVCMDGDRYACTTFLNEAEGDARVPAITAQRTALWRAICEPCVSGLEPACHPTACRALDPDDARVTAWLEARCTPAHTTVISLLAQGDACMALVDSPTVRPPHTERYARRGAVLLERACAAGSWEACGNMSYQYWQGNGPHGEMNERRGDERLEQARTLAGPACDAGDVDACHWRERDEIFRMPRGD